jgi:hypothetical protein
MTQLLMIKESILKFYQKHCSVIKPFMKFLVSFIVFLAIDQNIGYNAALKPWYIAFLLALAGMLMPMEILLFLAAAFMVIHIYAVSLLLAFIFMIVLLIIYFIYIRFTPKHGFIILAVPILSTLHLPYFLPIVLGILVNPLALIPLALGEILFTAVNEIRTVVSAGTTDTASAYPQILQQIFTNQDMYVYIGIFTLIFLIVYGIRTSGWNYCFESAVFAGTLFNLVFFLMGNSIWNLDMTLSHLILQTMLCGLLAYIFSFFRASLNYTGTERLQFEDDEYYYFVKAVPKMSVSVTELHVKHLTPLVFFENRTRISGKGVGQMHDALQEENSMEKDKDHFQENQFVRPDQNENELTHSHKKN